MTRATPPINEFYILSVRSIVLAIIHLRTKCCLPNRTGRYALDAMAAGIVYDVPPSKDILKVQKRHNYYFGRQFQLSGL